MAGDGSGLATVLRLAAMRDGVTPAVQDDLFGGDAPAGPVAKRDRGRPAGSKNRTSAEWERLILANYRPPLMVLADIYATPLGELVDELQAMADRHAREKVHVGGMVEEVRVLVDPVAVLRMQVQAAEAVAEYVHKKQPKAIEVANAPRGTVVLDLDAEDVAGGDGEAEIVVEQNQRVGDVARPQSDGAAVARDENAK